MKTIKINDWDEIPDNFTGIVDHLITRNKYWYKEGKLHREDGPAVEYSDGGKEWYIEGKHHREDGPAIICGNGSKYWYIEGEQHRLDGPAIEYADEARYWYIENYLYSPIWLDFLIGDSVFLGKEKGKHNLDWLRFLTDKEIKEFPFISGMESYGPFVHLFDQIFGAPIT